jgi:hypothetical protein
VLVLGLVALSALLVLQAPASAAPSITYQATVMATLQNDRGGSVYYRRGYWEGGSRGFGRDKVHGKHGITNDSIVAEVVRAPQDVYADDWRDPPVRYVYRKEALLIGLFGRVDDRVRVRVVVDHHAWSEPGQFGVVTAYCEGYQGTCPGWVNRAF